MTPTITNDDVGKRVETDDGDSIGVVAAVEGATAQVEPDPGMLDSIRAALGWESDPDDTVPLSEDAISEITDEAIRLGGELSAQGETVGTADRTDTSRRRDSESDRPPTSEDHGESSSTHDTNRDSHMDPGLSADELGDTEEMRATEDLSVTDDAGRPDAGDGGEGGERVDQETTEKRPHGTDTDSSSAASRDPEAEVRPENEDHRRTGARVDPDEPDRRSDADVEVTEPDHPHDAAVDVTDSTQGDRSSSDDAKTDESDER